MESDRARNLKAILDVYEAVGLTGSRPPGGLVFATGAALARELGYPEGDVASLPPEVLDSFVGAAALACEVTLPPDGWVADLGCGAGVDALLLARRGHPVVALDASPAMLGRLRSAAAGNVEPLRALLPDLPLAGGMASWVLLNGVANLVPERPRLLAEVFRVLRPGGRLLAADLLALGHIPLEVRELPEAWAWCVAGSGSPAEWTADLIAAGYREIRVEVLEEILPFGRGTIQARKPE